jgi:hypothetical protein
MTEGAEIEDVKRIPDFGNYTSRDNEHYFLRMGRGGRCNLLLSLGCVDGRSGENETMRDKVHFRWSCSCYDLNGDGRFAKEMVKGDVKKILQRDTRRRLKKELDEDIKSWQKCPKEIRICPNCWEDCSLCKYVGLDNTCLYESKSDLDIVVLAAKIAEEVVTADAIESAHKIKGTWFQEFSQMNEEERWAEYFRYPTPHFNEKPALKAGPSEPGGGAKNKAKKSKMGNKIFTDVWSGF